MASGTDLPNNRIQFKWRSFKNMESLTNTPRTAVKQQRFSEVVYSLISYNRQKGFQTTIFHSLAILLSISILFLLTQVYLIFLPCLKALLWALLCGSALYPFKAILDQSVESWLDELNQTERPFCVGFILLPFKSISKLYLLLIHFVAQNKILFIVFHFRFQIFHLLSLACGFLYPILQHNKGIITTTFILCISSQIFLMLLGSRHNFLRVLSTFNFVPSIILLAFFYLLHYLGLVGYVAFILFSLISMLGFIITVNGLRREHQSALFAELNTIVNTFGERLNAWIQNRLEPLRGKFADDSIDGDTNLGQQYTVALFTIFVFVIAEQMNLAYIILILFSIHIVVKKIIDHVYERLMIIGEIVSFYYNSLKNITLETLRKDILFQSLIYFFLKGDEMVRNFSFFSILKFCSVDQTIDSWKSSSSYLPRCHLDRIGDDHLLLCNSLNQGKLSVQSLDWLILNCRSTANAILQSICFVTNWATYNSSKTVSIEHWPIWPTSII